MIVSIQDFKSVKSQLDGYIFFQIQGDVVIIKQAIPDKKVKEILKQFKSL